MVVAGYILHPLQDFRFVYDLPSLGLFSAALYLVYLRRHPLLFAILFIVATVNRETTLFLLLFFVLANMVDETRIVWQRMYAPGTLRVVVPLALYWMELRLLSWEM